MLLLPRDRYLGVKRSEIAPTIKVLVVGGGGGGGSRSTGNPSFAGGGGGAGGYLEFLSVNISLGISYEVTIGAGGSASSLYGNVTGGNGSNSLFSSFVAYGGGGGGGGASIMNGNAPSQWASYYGLAGGSGGGAGAGASSSVGGTFAFSGAGFAAQGNNGGKGFYTNTPSNVFYGGGGGGAGSAGGTATISGNALGGDGRESTLNGVTYAAGGSPISLTAGDANTGKGGGAPPNFSSTGRSGGSGIVILRFLATLNITLSAGLTSSVTISGNEKIVTITGGTGTVTFS
jgi:hypothetical protein